MRKSPGSTEPGSVTTTLSPTSKLSAPQTTPWTPSSEMPSPCRVCLWPSGTTWTWHQLMVLPLDCGSGVFCRTLPTTMGPEMSGTWTSSSSSPTLTSSAMRSSGVPEAGNWVCSRIHDRGMRIWLHLHSEVLAEPDVAFNHVAHIQHPVAEHQGPLHTHAEGEA